LVPESGTVEKGEAMSEEVAIPFIVFSKLSISKQTDSAIATTERYTSSSSNYEKGNSLSFNRKPLSSKAHLT
jgi:hypothetical protein